MIIITNLSLTLKKISVKNHSNRFNPPSLSPLSHAFLKHPRLGSTAWASFPLFAELHTCRPMCPTTVFLQFKPPSASKCDAEISWQIPSRDITPPRALLSIYIMINIGYISRQVEVEVSTAYSFGRRKVGSLRNPDLSYSGGWKIARRVVSKWLSKRGNFESTN